MARTAGHVSTVCRSWETTLEILRAATLGSCCRESTDSQVRQRLVVERRRRDVAERLGRQEVSMASLGTSPS